MILYFLRHGQAEPARDGDDAARRLTEAGERALRSASPLWRRVNLRPGLVLTSPLPRAARTAEIVCEAVGLGRRPIPDDRLRPGARWADLAQAMAEHGGDARRVLFVGHEPDLSTAAALLSGASSIRLRTGGVACLEFPGIPEPAGGELAWLLDPDLYTDADGD